MKFGLLNKVLCYVKDEDTNLAALASTISITVPFQNERVDSCSSCPLNFECSTIGSNCFLEVSQVPSAPP